MTSAGIVPTAARQMTVRTMMFGVNRKPKGSLYTARVTGQRSTGTGAQKWISVIQSCE